MISAALPAWRGLLGLALAGALQLPSAQFTPPTHFALQTDLPVRDTAALAPVVGDRGEPARRLEAFFIEEADGGFGDGGAPATLSLSSVDARLSFEEQPSPIVASAAMAHLHRHLDLEASLDRVALREKSDGRASPRVEVWARLRLNGAPTNVLLAFIPGSERYLAAVASLPAARTAELLPGLEASLDSIRLRPAVSRFAPERWLSVLVWGAAGLAAVGWRVFRRSRR